MAEPQDGETREFIDKALDSSDCLLFCRHLEVRSKECFGGILVRSGINGKLCAIVIPEMGRILMDSVDLKSFVRLSKLFCRLGWPPRE